MHIVKRVIVLVAVNLIADIIIAKANGTESIVEKLYNQLTNK